MPVEIIRAVINEIVAALSLPPIWKEPSSGRFRSKLKFQGSFSVDRSPQQSKAVAMDVLASSGFKVALDNAMRLDMS